MLPPKSKIRHRREELHLTQQQVADKVGTSQQSFRLYERGEREPMISTALKIARALESTLEELFPDDVIEAYARPHQKKRGGKRKVK